MITAPRALLGPLVAGAIVLAGCGPSDGAAESSPVAATADRLAEQTAAGDGCAATQTSAELRTLVGEIETLPEASRADVAAFLDSLEAQLTCDPEPEPEPEVTEPPPPDDDDKGRGKGRDKKDDDDEDDD
jgi:hypothetical protein